MNRKQLERWAYAKPKCEMIEADAEQFICTSVLPKPESEEEDWEEEEEDGGVIRQS
nr:hypothetical protein [Hoylesella enoeca]